MTATCHAGRWKCAERSVDPGGSPVAGGAQAHSPFCVTCEQSIMNAIRDLRTVRFELAVVYGKTYSGFSSQIHADIPIREDVDEVTRKLDTAVRDWSHAVGYEMRLFDWGHATFATNATRLEAHAARLFQLGDWSMPRWADERQVPRLPLRTEGVVRASGEAQIWRTMSGADGALELRQLHGLADKLVERL